MGRRSERPRSVKVAGLLAELCRAHAGLTATLATIVALIGAAPAVFALASGEVIRVVQRGGPASGGLDGDLVRPLVLLGLAFALPEVLGPAGEGVADALSRRVTARMRMRTLRACMGPVGVSHLEDQAMLDQIARAEGSVLGRTPPGHGAVGLYRRYAQRLGGIASLVLVASFNLLLALMLLGALVLNRRILGRLHRNVVEIVNRRAGAMRRADYVRNLALEPGAAKEVRVFGLPRWLEAEYASTWRAVMGEVWSDRRRIRIPLLAATLPVLVAYVATLAYGAHAASSGRATLAELVVLSQAVLFTARLATVSHSDSLVTYAAAAVPAVAELETSVGALVRPPGPSTGRAPDMGAGIAFESVEFRYPGADDPVLRGLQLEIPTGRSLALVGLNGEGKTTVVKLLARLYEPTGGRITAGGVDIAGLDPTDWRRALAVVFQDFVRYPLSAADNVGLGAVDHLADRELLERAAARAGALPVIEGLPATWDTPLSRQLEGGTDLSGGQWQRIALARALAAREAGASVLILDEPTAQLDVRAEAAFYDDFLDIARGATTIIVSHRFATVRRADAIAVLAGGAVAELGTHDQLMARGGLYAELFAAQARHFAPSGAPDG